MKIAVTACLFVVCLLIMVVVTALAFELLSIEDTEILIEHMLRK